VRVVLVAVECLEYDFLKECNTPNIDKLNPHPAVSMGGTTRAAVAAILGGILPKCVVHEVEIDRSYIEKGIGLTDERRRTACEEHKFNWTNPFFLTRLKEKTNLLLYICNGWALEYLLPFMPDWLKDLNMRMHDRHSDLPTEHYINDFLSRVKNGMNNYFVYIHVQETHPPFYIPETRGKSVDEVKSYLTPQERRKRAVEWVDSQIGRIIEEVDYDCLVVCGDHALEHDVADPVGFKSFIAADVRNEKARNLWQL